MSNSAASGKGVVTYRNGCQPLRAGRNEPVRVNLSIGVNSPTNAAVKQEVEKIDKVLRHSRRPDLMMDLSITAGGREPWEALREVFEGPIGILPHYLAFDSDRGLDATRLVQRIESASRRGISFITIHATPSQQLLTAATSSRTVPITSRGGGVVIRDMLINRRKRSIYHDIFRDICHLATETGLVINLGTAFRSANVIDGMDAVTINELAVQSELICIARELGADVVLEGPGHVTISQIDHYLACTLDLEVPLMPLGPIVSDAFPGLDHLTNAIGASYMMARSRGGIVNCVTRVEHLGGIPNVAQLIEALDATSVAAHAASIAYRPADLTTDRAHADARSKLESCVLPTDWMITRDPESGSPGCSRCGALCPLIRMNYEC